jgi:hypothetical protein
MQTESQPITHLSLLRKYDGNIKAAHEKELRAAARSVPEGQNPITALFLAAREYEMELDKKYRVQGLVPAVCVDKYGDCEEDHCRCWK